MGNALRQSGACPTWSSGWCSWWCCGCWWACTAYRILGLGALFCDRRRLVRPHRGGWRVLRVSEFTAYIRAPVLSRVASPNVRTWQCAFGPLFRAGMWSGGRGRVSACRRSAFAVRRPRVWPGRRRSIRKGHWDSGTVLLGSRNPGVSAQHERDVPSAHSLSSRSAPPRFPVSVTPCRDGLPPGFSGRPCASLGHAGLKEGRLLGGAHWLRRREARGGPSAGVP